ncbi:FAD synthase [Candidatus Bathyarchaeota archaeon]|nr:FAD synthase [Candidatus Bathyarchaeota archaeon]MBS7628845.1 FAD synthase [Candidatus Bathyarchaeota archaeon]
MKRRRVVLAAGVFDLLHFGHLKALEDAKKAGGRGSRLIVIVARDRTVERRKGRRPILPEDQRRGLVEALKPVDKAILGYENMNVAGVIQKIKPDVIAIGYDQHDMLKAVQEALKTYPGKVKVVKMRRYGPRNLDSSSKIKRRVIEELKA